jgi:heat shock protein HslJ
MVGPLPADGVQGVTWRLSEQIVDGAMTAVPEEVLATLVLEAGNAGGNGGCNAWFATYAMDGASITFGPIGSTMMACEGPGGDTEAAYFANLEMVAAWASDGGSLTLSDADGNAVVVFEPAPLVGVVGGWVALGINNGADAVVTTDLTSMVTAIFDADGTLHGNDGCNDYSTTYTLDGDAISISDAIVTTRMACASEELSEQSAQYFAALVASTTWAFDPTGNLELRDDSGALQVNYAPAAG